MERQIKIALLTAGRSDYSIYLPLIKKLVNEKRLNLNIIAFGSHPYKKFGKTIKFIERDGFKIKHTVKALESNFTPEFISKSIGNTIKKFADIYKKEKFDLIFALGDRFEMFAAVSASVPFNIPIAHLHGGETTLGAVDEKFRHSISIMSKYHFTSTKKHAEKVAKIIGSNKYVYNVGALAIDNIKNLKLLTIEELREQLNIDFSKPTLLATIHPETVNTKINSILVNEFIKAIEKSGYQTLITLPNNDTENQIIREKLVKKFSSNKDIFMFEALGPLKYYSCMKYCYAVIGNSSSGIVEAASFGKYVINIGDRQKGRERDKNVIDVQINAEEILKKIKQLKEMSTISNRNIYGDGKTAERIITILKRELF